MVDHRLQALHLRFAESASTEDEAAWLAERLRAGEVSPANLELALFLGSAAARAVLVDPSPRTKAPKTGARLFVRKLKPWGGIACLRAAIAATRLFVSSADEKRLSIGLRHLHLAEEYALEPSPEIARAISALPEVRLSSPIKWQAAALIGVAARAVAKGSTCFEWRAKEAVAEVVEELKNEKKVRAQIVSELLPWALGYRDPVRMRVQERRSKS